MVNLKNFSVKPKVICSIDASTNNLAFALFENDKVIKYGKIAFSGANVFEKTASAARQVAKELSSFKIDAIVIEHTVFINSPKTMADLSMVQGGIISAAILNGINKITTVSPITWQNFIGNKAFSKVEKLETIAEYPGKSTSWYKTYERNIRKQKTINFVNINYDVETDDNDIADAIGIGHYAINNWEKVDK